MILSRDTQIRTSLFIGPVKTKLLVKYGRFSAVMKLIPILIQSQFYIQLLYRPHFGICFLPFGLLGSKKKISETTEFLFKYATFFMFSWAKI